MLQDELMSKSKADYLRHIARAQANACQSNSPMGCYGQAALGNMWLSQAAQITGPYESRSMNRRLAEAKAFCASLKESKS